MIVDFVKGNLFLAVFGVICLGLTAVAGWDTISKQSKVNQYKEQVEEVRASARAFTKFEWMLSPKNENVAKSNAEMAEKNFTATLSEIVDRYNVQPQSDPDMTPGQVKNLIARRSRVMENKLRGENIEIPESLKDFTFGPYRARDVFPNPRQIFMIVKQLEIMDELVNLLAGSEVTQVTTINRDELEPTSMDLHSYVEFEIDMVGKHASIVHFLNSLHSSKYFFVLRKIDIEAVADSLSDLSNKTTDKTTDRMNDRMPDRMNDRMNDRMPDRMNDRMNSARRTRDVGKVDDSESDPESSLINQLQQHDRIVFMKYPLLQAKILLAYYEFHDREG